MPVDGDLGFQPVGELGEAARYYYLMQQLQSRYVMTPVESIRYHSDGKLYDITAALKTDARKSNQVLVTYESGLTVAVNYNATERWQVELGGNGYDLSPFAWAAVADAFKESCTEQDGRRIGFVDSPAYLFADGGGKLRDFGPIATDGAVVVLRDDPQRLRLIPLADATTVSLDIAPGARVQAYDANDQPLAVEAVAREGGRATLPLQGVDYWLIGA